VSCSPSCLKFSSISFLTLAGRRHAKDYQPDGIRVCKVLRMVITMTSYINNHLRTQLISGALTVCCQCRKYKKKVCWSRECLQSKNLSRKETLRTKKANIIRFHKKAVKLSKRCWTRTCRQVFRFCQCEMLVVIS